ncbi:hypothetical protein [Fibrella aquatica]|uniref:hypothetical protein n=1 Tax=Fibrella aquatica TaxID=3242487 RepID=UPI003520848A
MNTIDLKNWGVMRVVRLIAGVGIIWSAFTDHQPLLSLVGGLLLFQAMTNTGCGAAGCSVPSSTKTANKSVDDVEYEEVR